MNRRQTILSLAAIAPASVLPSSALASASPESRLPITWVGDAKLSAWAPDAIDYIDKVLKAGEVFFTTDIHLGDDYAVLRDPHFTLVRAPVFNVHTGYEPGDEGVDIHIVDGPIKLKARSQIYDPVAYHGAGSSLTKDFEALTAEERRRRYRIRNPHKAYFEDANGKYTDDRDAAVDGYSFWPKDRHRMDFSWLTPPPKSA